MLGSLPRFANAVVEVVGRFESSVSLTNHHYLSQDRCEHPLITHGHVWSDKIQIWIGWEKGMPKTPKLEVSDIASKLSIVRQTTELGSHREPGFKADGRSIVYTHMADVPNEWAIVYGRIVRAPDVNDVPLVIIAQPYNIHSLRDDGSLSPEEK